MIAQEKPLIDKLINLSLPPLPESALRVVKLTSDLNTSARTIAAAISADPGLTTFILRIANSVMYGTDKKITSLLDAVNRLGDRVIYQSVIGFVFSTTLKNKKASSKLENTLWEHSICVALAARQISLLLGMRGTEEAFLCGLLHDIGKLLMLRFDSKAYQEIAKIESESKMLECEIDIFGYSHSEVGSLAAANWLLAQEVIDTISAHHQPSLAKTSILYAHIINVADNLANTQEQGIRQLDTYDTSSYQSIEILKLTEKNLQTVWTKVYSNLGELLRIWGF